MSRFLFVVPPLTGHVNPTVSVAAELESRGHQVAWVGHPGQVKPLLAPGAQLIELDDSVPAALLDDKTQAAHNVRGLAALKFLWEDFFVPLARAMVPGVERAVDDFQPDLLVVDQQALAGALVARKKGLNWVTLATTSAGVTDPLVSLPKVREWLLECFALLEREAGLEVTRKIDCSPHAVIVFSTRALVGMDANFPAHFHFVGPSIQKRNDPTPFPWDALTDQPRILVSLGTVNADRGRRFYQTTVDAFADQPLQIVMVAPDDLVPHVPANFVVQKRVPQLELLPHLDAVVSHAGHNTVCETLAHGLPLVLAPIKDDQPVVAQQVVEAGAGIRVRFGRISPAELRNVVHTILNDGSYRDAAKRIQASFHQAGGESAVATVLENLQ